MEIEKKATQLELDTVAYFANLSDEEAAKERELESLLAQSASDIDMDATD